MMKMFKNISQVSIYLFSRLGPNDLPALAHSRPSVSKKVRQTKRNLRYVGDQQECQDRDDKRNANVHLKLSHVLIKSELPVLT
jgi:hypothetical protein